MNSKCCFKTNFGKQKHLPSIAFFPFSAECKGDPGKQGTLKEHYNKKGVVYVELHEAKKNGENFPGKKNEIFQIHVIRITCFFLPTRSDYYSRRNGYKLQ